MQSINRLLYPRAAVVAALSLVLLFIVATPALGASVPLTVDRLTDDSRAVVVADCVSTVSRAIDPSVGPRSGIVTDVTLRVVDSISGTSGSTIMITQPGGELDGIGLVVSELTAFSRNQRYVVFVGSNGQVVGGAQGALAVVGDRVGPSRESLSSLKRRVKAAAGTPMTLAETIAETIVARAADAAEAIISPLATPVISSMTPSDVSAGTGDVVTIYGTGFGGTQGSVSFYRDSTSIVAATVNSWSDTSISCVVPMGAGSGVVRVTNDSEITSSGYTYDVGFSFGGAKWGSGVLSETYRINPNCADATSAEVSLVSAAAATWSTVSSFSFVNGGACTSTNNPPPSDSKNDIYWASSGFTSSGILAWNRYWYYMDSPYNRIFETDIVFNDSFNWGDGTGGTFDIQAVALHELGHSLNLGDQYGPGDASESKVMYGMIPSGTQRRTLTEDDIAGIRWIYGVSGDVTAPVMGAVSSATHPSDTTWYQNNNVTFSWSATDASPITYSYVLDHSSGTVPDTTPEGAATTVTYNGLADGEWYLHVRARDDKGNWSTTQQRRVRVDVTAPAGSFSLNGGASTTATTSVTVDSAVIGAAEMRIAADGVTYGSWQAYATHQAILLPEVVGTRTVAVQYRDAALNTSTLMGSIVFDPEVRVFDWTEISGPDRYSTARAVSRSAFADGSDTVIISTGENYPDALGAGGLAGAAECPILLVKKTGALPTAVASEIKRLGATQVYITGSTAAVSAQTELDLKKIVGSAKVTRLGGRDRYATANLIAIETVRILAEKGTPFSGTAFVTTGLDFPDALLASPVAYAEKRPIFIVGRSGADGSLRATIASLGVTQLDIVGSTTSISTAVEAALAGVEGVSVERVASANDKYAMTVAFSDWACAEEGFTCDDMGVTIGDRFPDALAAGPLQGISRSLVVLTPPNYLDSRIRAMMEANYDTADSVRFYGTTAAVSQATRDSIVGVLE